MIILINGRPALDRFGYTNRVGRLVSPRSGNRIQLCDSAENGTATSVFPWAADNDAFLAWDEDRFRSMLARLAWTPGCKFVAAPDVVGNAYETIQRFWDWRNEIASHGLPVALVGQDGAEDLVVPWDAFDAWFIGGSTEWKLSKASEDLAREAKAQGKWVHMGRVNSRRRLRHAFEIGCDSIDGTGFSMFPDKYLAKGIRWLREIEREPVMF